MRKINEKAKANRDRVKRYRKHKNAAGFKQILVWVEKGQLERFRDLCRKKNINQEQAFAEALIKYGAAASYKICPECDGYGCQGCSETGWIKP